MANIGAYPYLEYTIVPSPLIINEKQDIIILATLKTSVQNGSPLSSVIIKNVVLDFGDTGSDATDLTTVANAITLANFESNPNWSFSKGGGVGMSFIVAPTTVANGQIMENVIMIKLNNVVVNDKPGNVTITITETVSQVNGSPLKSGNVNQASLVLPKIKEKHALKTIFTASNNYIKAGDSTILSWKGGPPGASYSLHYLKNNQLVNVTSLSANGSYPTDPNISPLILDETTNFILKIKDSAEDSYLTRTVIVQQQTLYAQQVNIGGSTPGSESLNIQGHMSIGDSLNNGVMYIPTQEEGQFYFRTGNDNAYTDLAQISNQGNLNVGGNITVNGSVTSSTNYITGATLTNVAGWAGGTSVWSNATTESSGGTTIANMAGFSLTSGNGNFGYYEINLGGVVEGILMVDMYIVNYSGNGMGFWHIIGSENAFTNGKFDTTSTYQLWSTFQNPTWGQIYPNNVIRKRVRTYFKGQFIYLGATDLNEGQLGIKMNSMALSPLI
tara:strand:- start:35406 stop:36905 length:1500 start_codon:yes stop_codon:yes gene_type:complete